MDFKTIMDYLFNNVLREILTVATMLVIVYLIKGGIIWYRSREDSNEAVPNRDMVVAGATLMITLILFWVVISGALNLIGYSEILSINSFVNDQTVLGIILGGVTATVVYLVATLVATFQVVPIVARWLKHLAITLVGTKSDSIAAAYLVQRGITVSKAITMALVGWGLIVVGILTGYITNSLLLPVSTIFIMVLMLPISDFALLWYRLNKGYYGNNPYEAREMLKFVLENSDDFDFPSDSGLKEFVSKGAVKVNAEKTYKVGATS